MKSILKKLLITFISTVGIYLLLLWHPNPLFAHQYDYQNFVVYSDRAIPQEMETVLKDAEERLSFSELYEQGDTFRIYICNDAWRFAFFTRNPNAGGVVNFPISPNVFIRESDIPANELIPPKGWMYTPKERPLSYFIAHEATHSLQRKTDPFLQLKAPVHIIEGYADYIGKCKDFDFETFKNLYLNDDFVMNPANGLYNKYHLYVAYLMEKKGFDFEQLVKEQPSMEVLEELK
ncbi:MAG: hypothetical protein AB8B69_23500 [Chitinophagales bacterium]